MGSDFNPYSPPKKGPALPPRPESAEVLASCTVLITAKQKGPHRIARIVRTWLYPGLAGITGFTMTMGSGLTTQIVVALACGGIVWLVVTLAEKKPAFVHRVTYRFYDDGFDAEADGSGTRVEWASIRNFVDGPDSLILHNGSAHVFPTRGLPTDDVAALRALFADKVPKSG
jgi:YcxB-like protein